MIERVTTIPSRAGGRQAAAEPRFFGASDRARPRRPQLVAPGRQASGAACLTEERARTLVHATAAERDLRECCEADSLPPPWISLPIPTGGTMGNTFRLLGLTATVLLLFPGESRAAQDGPVCGHAEEISVDDELICGGDICFYPDGCYTYVCDDVTDGVGAVCLED